jgi:ketosteroid isomerase-like protein
MPDPAAELNAFMKAYEEGNNSHDVERVAPMITPDATYWFTDGSYSGLAQITTAISETFRAIQNETYQISELEWIYVTTEHAACRYRFAWTGLVGGQLRSGEGRGTNVLTKHEGFWKIHHEHLST